MSYRRQQRQSGAPGFFWTPPDKITGDQVILFGSESKHAVSVCRLGAGELITVCDGEGNAHDCEIVTARSQEVTARIIRSHRRLGEPACHVTLAAGVGRPSNFDWIVEKAVELGVGRIIPVRASRSPAGIGGEDAARRRALRWRRLTLGAMKQTLRSCRPPVNEIVSVTALAAEIQDHQYTVLADPEGNRLDLAGQTSTQLTRVLLIVGPEAGFTTEEHQALTDQGAVSFHLGARRLRAETAAIASLTLLMRELGEL